MKDVLLVPVFPIVVASQAMYGKIMASLGSWRPSQHVEGQLHCVETLYLGLLFLYPCVCVCVCVYVRVKPCWAHSGPSWASHSSTVYQILYLYIYISIYLYTSVYIIQINRWIMFSLDANTPLLTWVKDVSTHICYGLLLVVFVTDGSEFPTRSAYLIAPSWTCVGFSNERYNKCKCFKCGRAY